jgi:hypothetical protein
MRCERPHEGVLEYRLDRGVWLYGALRASWIGRSSRILVKRLSCPGIRVRYTIKWSLDLMFPREIEQLVTLRDVEGMEKLGATLGAMRGAAQSAGDAAS